MVKNNYSGSISLHCPTCGGSDFEFENKEGPLRCVGCDRVFMKEDLIRENGARVEEKFKEIKSAIMSDIRKDFKKLFGK